MINKDWSIS